MTGLMAASAVGAVDAWLAPLPLSATQGRVGTAAANESSGEPQFLDVDFSAAMSELTLGIIGEAAFGAPMARGHGYAVLPQLLGDAVRANFSMSAFIPGYRSLPTPGNRAAAAAVATVRATLLGVLQQRLASRRTSGASTAPASGTPGANAAPATASGAPPATARLHLLVDCLLDAAESDGGNGAAPFSLTEVLDEAMTFVFAGEANRV